VAEAERGPQKVVLNGFVSTLDERWTPATGSKLELVPHWVFLRGSSAGLM
jgi:hypothetical protein